MVSRDNGSIAAYYDAFARRLLHDYVHGNPRFEAGLAHALRYLPPQAAAVLDIGCGIGWSSRAIASHLPRARVTGVDLSMEALTVAERLCRGLNGVDFWCGDVADPRALAGRSFDAVVMLDVYEHIPTAGRERLHGFLNAALSPSGRLILSFPSGRHQEHLRRHDPSGLQPVDEVIGLAEVAKLAADVGAEVLLYQHRSIWHENDYVHVALARLSSAFPRRRPPRRSLRRALRRAIRTWEVKAKGLARELG